jgi:hypothetical protein
MSRPGLFLLALLLTACEMAAAQVAPASSQTPARAPQANAAPLAKANTAKTAASASAMALAPQQRMLDEADQLLDLAQKLKAEVDKTNQYTLSVKTVRHAQDIEKLAKNLQKQVQHEDR